MRRNRSITIGLLLVGALAALAGWSQDWFTFDVSEAASMTETSIAGSTVASFVSAIAFGVLAATAVLTISHRVLRLVILIVGVALSVAGVMSVLFTVAEPISSSVAALSRLTGVADISTLSSLISITAISAWPFIAIAGFAVCLAGSILGLATSWTWVSGASRFNRPESSTRRTKRIARKLESGEAWDTLSHGEDPTG